MQFPASSEEAVLFIDDDVDGTQVLIRALQRRGVASRFLQTTSAESALSLFQVHRPQVAIVDLNLSSRGPEEGLELVQRLHAIDSDVRIIVLTGFSDSATGVKALHAGASSFLSKPVDCDHLGALVTDGIAAINLSRSHQSQIESGPTHAPLSSRNKSMLEVLRTAEFLTRCDLPVLIIGETGCGKGLIAKYLHERHIERKGAFVRYQPSFASGDLVASELFGHARGAFTGAHAERRGLLAEADRGTLFLDEVDELPPGTQVLLLHALQEKRFRSVGSDKERTSNFRLVAATNRPLEALLESGRLRSDLYYRIAQTVLIIPPLRERPEDIPEIANEHLRTLVRLKRARRLALNVDAQETLLNHTWPGNVRELLSVIESAALRASSENVSSISARHLTFARSDQQQPLPRKRSFRAQVAAFERSLLERALEENGHNLSRAAASLELDRTSFRRMLARHQNSEQ